MNSTPEDTQIKLVSRTLKDYLLYFPALTISSLMGLVTVAVLSKFFSPSDYGHYMLALSTLLLLSMGTALWLRTSVLRLLPQYAASNQVNEFVGTLAGAGLLVTVAVVVLYALLLLWLGPGLEPQLYQLLWLVVPGVLVLTVFAVLQDTHRIQGHSALYSGLILLRVVGSFVAGVFLAIVLGWGVSGMLVGLILVAGAAIGGHLVSAGRRLASTLRSVRWSAPVLKEMLSFSLPIVGLNLASSVLAVSDRYLIEAYLSSYALGIYTVSYGLAEGGMRLIANTFLVATQPNIFNTWVADGPQAAFRFIERLFRYYLMLALPALVGMSLLRDEVVTLFATPEYAAGSAVVVYVSLALFLHGYSLIVGTVFDATKQTMIPFVLFLIAGLVNVALNLLLLPRFGYLAAAWSTCAGYGLLLVLNVVAAQRIVRLRVVGAYFWRIALASAVMGGSVLAMQHWLPPSLAGLVVTVILAVIVYAAATLAVGGVPPEEKQALRARLDRIISRFRRPVLARNTPAQD